MAAYYLHWEGLSQSECTVGEQLKGKEWKKMPEQDGRLIRYYLINCQFKNIDL